MAKHQESQQKRGKFFSIIARLILYPQRNLQAAIDFQNGAAGAMVSQRGIMRALSSSWTREILISCSLHEKPYSYHL